MPDISTSCAPMPTCAIRPTASSSVWKALLSEPSLGASRNSTASRVMAVPFGDIPHRDHNRLRGDGCAYALQRGEYRQASAQCGEEPMQACVASSGFQRCGSRTMPVSLQTRRARGPSFRSRRCAQTRMWPAVHQGRKKGHHADDDLIVMTTASGIRGCGRRMGVIHNLRRVALDSAPVGHLDLSVR